MNVQDAVRLFGVDPQTIIRRVNNGESFELVKQEIVKECRQRHREMILKLHPDVGGDEERCKDLNQAMDLVRAMVWQKPAPQPQYPWFGGFTIIIGGFTSGGSAGSTSTVYGNWPHS